MIKEDLNMKKILMALMLCLISIASFGQNWDALSHQYKMVITTEVYERRTFLHDSNQVAVLQDTIYKYYKIPNGNVPYVIYQNYTIGSNCFKAGSYMICIGGVASLTGLSLMLGDKNNITAYKAGIGLTSIGGTLVSVSLPLLCFGDHIKRETNMLYSILK